MPPRPRLSFACRRPAKPCPAVRTGFDPPALPLHMRKANLAQLLRRRPEGIFVAPFERGEIGPNLFDAACQVGLEGLVSWTDASLLLPAARRRWGRFERVAI